MEFEELLMKCNIQETGEQTLTHYLGGLNEEIANIVQLQLFWMVDDVTILNLKVEKQMIQRKNNHFPKERIVSNHSKLRWVTLEPSKVSSSKTPQNNKNHGSSCSSESSKRCFNC